MHVKIAYCLRKPLVNLMDDIIKIVIKAERSLQG